MRPSVRGEFFRQALRLSLALALAWVVILFPSCSQTTRVAARSKTFVRAHQPKTKVELARKDQAALEEEPTDSPPPISDPLRPVNRVIHRFNNGVYSYVLTPTAKVYDAIMPDPVERRIGNVFENVRYPRRVVGNVLQGKFRLAGRETGRFVVDSTVGLLGAFRPSEKWFGWKPENEDTGQTLGVWGVGSGPYLELPLLGPSSVRDSFGLVADGFLDPLNYLGARPSWAARGGEILNDSPILTERYNSAKLASLDFYTALKDAYSQTRAQALRE